MPWLFVYFGACSFFWVVSEDESEFEEPVENVFEEQYSYPTEETSGKMIITLDNNTIFAC